MMSRQDGIMQWQRSLRRCFRGPSGIVGERVQYLIEAERNHRQEMAQSSYGFTTLTDSYQHLALRTYDESLTHGHVLHVHNYALNVAIVQRLRSALNTFYDGYYFDATGLLRGAFEILLYLGDVLQGRCQLNDLWSIGKDGNSAELDAPTFHKQRRKHLNKLIPQIQNRMYGNASGLSASEQQQVKRFFETFHGHVHRGESNVVHFVCDMLQYKQPPTIAPVFNLLRSSIFCNAAVCVAWMHTRVMPYLSLPERYSAQWHEQYQVLDESFRGYLQGWDKPVASALLKFIDCSYAFDDAVASQQVKAEPCHDADH